MRMKLTIKRKAASCYPFVLITGAITMATANNADGLAVLEKSPQAFGQVLCQFRVCHDLCVYTDNKILDRQMRDAIDQCATDFRHMSMQTATLSDQVSSVWCRTCILFFENLTKIKGDPGKILQKISDQAKDLSAGFKGLADWCRRLAATFHKVQALGEGKSKDYSDQMEEAKREAEEAMDTLKYKLDKAAAEAEKQRKRANRWLIAASIPVVNLVTGIGAAVTATRASDAERLRHDADKKCDEAKRDLQQAVSVAEKAKVQCMFTICDTMLK